MGTREKRRRVSSLLERRFTSKSPGSFYCKTRANSKAIYRTRYMPLRYILKIEPTGTKTLLKNFVNQTRNF